MPTILIVEDDKLVSRLIENLLNKKGFKTFAVADGRAAAQFIIENSRVPDLVLLDLMLPYIDGFGILNLMRSRSNWKNVPIIMLTSKGQEKNIVRAFESGVNDYMVKPFNREEVVVRINRQLQNYESFH